MQLVPAIDLRGGQVVRLLQGDASRQTVYDGNPQGVAEYFLQQGAQLIHVVDLDGAFVGGSKNLCALEQILRVPGVKVELGGGLRTREAVEKALEIGVSRVVLGTMAVTDPEQVYELAAIYKDKVVVGIDAYKGDVAVRGWTEKSGINFLEMAAWMEQGGVPRLIFTDISRDGTLDGPNFQALEAAANKLSIPVIASGGVSSLQDLYKLRQLEPLGIEGVIVGKALYEKIFTLADAIQVCGGEKNVG